MMTPLLLADTNVGEARLSRSASPATTQQPVADASQTRKYGARGLSHKLLLTVDSICR
jgi:hypothetical protein